MERMSDSYERSVKSERKAVQETFAEREDALQERADGMPQRSYQQRGGEQRLHMKFAASAVSPYERHVILGNECPAFLEMHTVRNGADFDIFYRMTGYSRLETYVKRNRFSGYDLLRITADTLNLMKSCEEYLLFPEYLSFRTDHVFVSSEDDSLRLIYLPGYRTTRSLKSQVVRFLDDIVYMGKPQRFEDVLGEYRDQVLLNEYGLKDYISAAEDLVRRNRVESVSEAPADEAYRAEAYGARAAAPVPIFGQEEEENYFSQKIGGLIGVKEKLIDFVESIFS